MGGMLDIESVNTKSAGSMLSTQLSATPQFAGLADDILQQVMVDSFAVTLSANEHLSFCGDGLTHYHLLEFGQVQLYRPSHTGEEKVFHIAHAGELFFEYAVFLPKPIAPLSALALSDCRLHQLSASALHAALTQSDKLVLQLLQSVSTNLYHAINRIDTLTISNASQRLVLYLLEFMQHHDSAKFHLDVSQKMLSKQLNVAPETLSRMLSKLCDSGFLSYQRGQVCIHDADKLKQYVELPITDCDCQSHYRNQGELLGC